MPVGQYNNSKWIIKFTFHLRIICHRKWIISLTKISWMQPVMRTLGVYTTRQQIHDYLQYYKSYNIDYPVRGTNNWLMLPEMKNRKHKCISKTWFFCLVAHLKTKRLRVINLYRSKVIKRVIVNVNTTPNWRNGRKPNYKHEISNE